MDILLIVIVALLASGISLVSGFGLGTVLMPAFALMLPLPTAIAATALVHLVHSLTKLAVTGRHADGRVVLRFGVPAVMGAVAGGSLLGLLGTTPPLAHYTLAGYPVSLTPLNLVIGALLIATTLNLGPKTVPLTLGGLASGFLGGLSGFQGALRSAALLRLPLSKDAFVATGAVTAALVDLTRTVTYGFPSPETTHLVLPAIIAATVGVFWGQRILGHLTKEHVHTLTRGLLLTFGVLMMAGLL